MWGGVDIEQNDIIWIQPQKELYELNKYDGQLTTTVVYNRTC